MTALTGVVSSYHIKTYVQVPSFRSPLRRYPLSRSRLQATRSLCVDLAKSGHPSARDSENMAGTACKEWRGPYVKNVDFTQEMPTMNTGKVLEMSPQSLTTPSQLFMHFFT